RVGRIDVDFARALHIFRRLRNTFAHETAGASFDHGPSRDRIRELAAPAAHLPIFSLLRESYFKTKAGTASEFFTVSALLVARLEAACASVQRLTVKTTMLIPGHWKKSADDAS